MPDIRLHNQHGLKFDSKLTSFRQFSSPLEIEFGEPVQGKCMNTIGLSDKRTQAKKMCDALLLFIFYFWMSEVFASEQVIGRYLRIDLPGDERVLALAEVQVYSGEKLVSQLGRAKQVTTFRSATADKAIDGDTSGVFFAGSVTGTQPGSFVWWELDLGADQVITKIAVHNRTDCCAEKINPAHIVLRNNAQKIVWRDNIETTQSRYVFDVNQASTSLTPVGRNLLKNATFQQRTNSLLPDYWDLHHAAAVTFKDLHKHYGVDLSITPPFPGVDVLKIVNSEANFRFVILMPTNIQSSLPGGDYTFSVYVKADQDAVISFTQAWGVGKEVTKRISTEWKRYTFTAQERDEAAHLQPVMYFPKKGTYFVAAPQLEEGLVATLFDGEYGGAKHQSSRGSATVKPKTRERASLEPELNGEELVKKFQLMVEYDYYTSQDSARLWLSSPNSVHIKGDVACETATGGKVFFKKQVPIAPKSYAYVGVPIKNLPPGMHRCKVNYSGRGTEVAMSDVYIKKIRSSPLEVRSNTVKRFFTINDAPFYIIGIYVRAGDIPEWYFKDIREHGINTVFYNRHPNSSGEYDLKNIKSVVAAAAKHNLKIVVGLSMAGAKPADWRSKTTGFLEVIEQLKGYPQIIGWYPVDEPSANTWTDDELIDIYNSIKRADPYRFVFVNWAADGIPKQIGQQPRGTLSATDVYAIDYYPFTTPKASLQGFIETTRSAGLTAEIYNKPFFSWLQLFGSGIASREPTGPELNYMAFTNFIYKGMISYWDTKSNSAATWEHLKMINLQGAMLADKLFLNENAFQILAPVVTENFLYTAWKKGESLFLIVVNRASLSREFSYDVFSLMPNKPKLSVRSVFEGRNVRTPNSQIAEFLDPYESRVYEIKYQ